MVDIVAMAVSKAKKQSDINIIKNTGSCHSRVTHYIYYKYQHHPDLLL